MHSTFLGRRKAMMIGSATRRSCTYIHRLSYWAKYLTRCLANLICRCFWEGGQHSAWSMLWNGIKTWIVYLRRHVQGTLSCSLIVAPQPGFVIWRWGVFTCHSWLHRYRFCSPMQLSSWRRVSNAARTESSKQCCYDWLTGVLLTANELNGLNSIREYARSPFFRLMPNDMTE